MTREQIKHQYEEACNAYLREFARKHGVALDPMPWVANNVGDNALVGDYYVSMETMRVDIDNDAPESEFLKWYDYCQYAEDFGFTSPNFSSWLKGCPRYSEEDFARLRTLKREYLDAVAKMKERCH